MPQIAASRDHLPRRAAACRGEPRRAVITCHSVWCAATVCAASHKKRERIATYRECDGMLSTGELVCAARCFPYCAATPYK
eukprot:2529578-Prymnesium_polylepis.1